MKLKRKVPRFAVFARVSTRDQLTGYSLDTQVADAREYVQKIGGTVAKVYKGAESATKAAQEDREMLSALLADAERGSFDAVVCQDSSRIARHPLVGLQTIEGLAALGIVTHDFSGPIPFGTPDEEFVTHVKFAAHRFSARTSTAKSIRNRLDVLRNGGIAAGRPPWGRRWIRAEKRFEVVEEQQNLMRSAYDLLVNRRHSLGATARRLGIAQSSLRKAINQAALTKVTQTLKGERFEFKLPPLLNPFEQKRMVRRLAENLIIRPAIKTPYLLQGVVKCAKCNAHMTGMTSIKGAYRYSVYRHPPERYKEGCTWHAPSQMLDDDVLTACAEIVKNGDSLRDAIRAELEQRHGNAEPKLKQRRADLKAAIRKHEEELDRIVDTLAGLGKSAPKRIKGRTLKRVEQVERAMDADEADLKQVEAELEELQVPGPDADEIAAKLRSLYWGNGAGPRVGLTLDQRKQFVRTIIGIAPDLGVFVQMHRYKGGSKKAVYWKWRLKGLVASAENWLEREGDPTYPEVGEVTLKKGSAVERLASIAGSTRGIREVRVSIKST